MINLPAYFFRRGLLTEEEAKAANRHIGDLSKDRVLMGIDRIAGKSLEVGKRSACRFCDWLFITGKQGEMIFTHFIVKVVKRLSRGPAYRLNLQTLQEHREKGFEYFKDAVSASALAILFGGTYRRILRIELLQNFRDPVKFKISRMKGGKETIESREEHIVLVNGEYQVFCSDIMRDFIDRETGEFFVISESMYAPGFWTVGRKLIARSSMIQTAIGLARSNFVGLECGRQSQRVCELIGEHRDSRRSRHLDYHWNVIDASYAFCDTNTELTEQARNILRVELGRDLVTETDAYEYYVASTCDKPHKRAYYRMLKMARETMLEQLNNEDF